MYATMGAVSGWFRHYWLKQDMEGGEVKLTARVFEAEYGGLAREEYGALKPRQLAKALAERSPPIEVSVRVLTEWLKTVNWPAGVVPISSRHELDEKHGEVLTAMAKEHGSGWRLWKAMKERDPPVYVTLGAANRWFERYSEAAKGSGRKRGREEESEEEDSVWV